MNNDNRSNNSTDKTNDSVEHVSVSITESISVSTQAKAAVYVGSTGVAYTESLLNGRAAHASLNDATGVISHGFVGNPAQHEEGTLLTCQTLVAVLNQQGGDWSAPVVVEEPHVDAVCASLRGGVDNLRIQVVRAQTKKAFWKAASRHGGNSAAGNDAQLADELAQSIQFKADRIPFDDRKKIVLALNALDLAGYALGDVAKMFRTHHGRWARSIGFMQIWLVGPVHALTHRLT